MVTPEEESNADSATETGRFPRWAALCAHKDESVLSKLNDMFNDSQVRFLGVKDNGSIDSVLSDRAFETLGLRLYIVPGEYAHSDRFDALLKRVTPNSKIVFTSNGSPPVISRDRSCNVEFYSPLEIAALGSPEYIGTARKLMRSLIQDDPLNVLIVIPPKVRTMAREMKRKFKANGKAPMIRQVYGSVSVVQKEVEKHHYDSIYIPEERRAELPDILAASENPEPWVFTFSQANRVYGFANLSYTPTIQESNNS